MACGLLWFARNLGLRRVVRHTLLDLSLCFLMMRVANCRRSRLVCVKSLCMRLTLFASRGAKKMAVGRGAESVCISVLWSVVSAVYHAVSYFMDSCLSQHELPTMVSRCRAILIVRMRVPQLPRSTPSIGRVYAACSDR